MLYVLTSMAVRNSVGAGVRYSSGDQMKSGTSPLKS